MPTATHPRLRTADGRAMTAVSKDSKVKPLGYIVWFSVPDENVPLRKLRKSWGLSGLDPKPLPRDQRAVNVFKRAVRDQAGVHRDETNGTVTETDVRDVLENAEDVIYQVSRVVRDVNDRVVNYPKALRVWFSKVTGEIGFKPLGEVHRRDVLPIMDAIQADFDKNTKAVTGAKVRTLVRHYIKDDSDEGAGMVGLSGESLRGKAGGVYFVLARHKDQLDSLAEMLDDLYEPRGRAYLYMVPLADGASERELIRRQYVANSVKDMEEAMDEVRGLLREDRDRAVRENVIKHHFGKLERIRRRAGQYNDALREEQEDVQTHMDLLSRQLRKLMAL